MKKTTLVLGAMLCVGITQVSISHMSQAQPAPLSFNQILLRSQHEVINGDYQTVEEDARGLKALARSPQEEAQALDLLAESFFGRQDYDEARKQWNSVLELSGTGDIERTQAFAQVGLARSYDAQGSYDKAIPHFKVAVDYFDQNKTDKDSFFAAFFSLALSDTLYNAHQNDLALKQLDRTIALVQNAQDTSSFLVFAYHKRGQLHLEQGQLAEGRADFEQVVKLGKTANMGTDDFSNYAQNTINGFDNIKHLLTADGNLKQGLRVVTHRPTEFDQKVSRMIAKLTDLAPTLKGLPSSRF